MGCYRKYQYLSPYVILVVNLSRSVPEKELLEWLYESVCLLSAWNAASGTADCCLFMSFLCFSPLIKMRRPDCKKTKKNKNKNYVVNKETTCLNQFPCLLSASGYCHNSVWSKHYLLVKKHLPFRCYITRKCYITEGTVQGGLFLKHVQKHYKWSYLKHRLRFINQTQKWSKFYKTWANGNKF